MTGIADNTLREQLERRDATISRYQAELTVLRLVDEYAAEVVAGYKAGKISTIALAKLELAQTTTASLRDRERATLARMQGKGPARAYPGKAR
jgi:hypothetical protein